jgi:hypothetical protein
MIKRLQASKQLEDAALTRVTDTYFPEGIEIDMSKLKFNSGKLRVQMPWQKRAGDAEAKPQKPWSGHWYPFAEGQLWKWTDSPLRKYDLYRKARGRDGSATDQERTMMQDRESWEGYCEEWAFASVFSPAPTKDVSFNLGGQIVTFTQADIKALLLHTFTGVPRDKRLLMGQRFSPRDKAWIMDDAYPDQVLGMLKQFHEKEKRVFFMDRDPSEEVWTVPVFASMYIIEAVPNRDDAVAISMIVDYVDSILSFDDREKHHPREGSPTYYAYLFGTRKKNKLIVDSGIWRDKPDDSELNHPDYFIVMENEEQFFKDRKSSNAMVDVDLVDEIAGHAR